MAHSKTRTRKAADATSPRESIADGVRLGYQVIDAYLKQGQRFARQFVAPGSGRPANGNSDDLDIRSVQILTELMANWSDLLGLYTEGLNAAGGSTRRQHESEEQEATASVAKSKASSIRLAYEITSRRPALVDVEFFSGRETFNLASHGLRCLGSSGPDIGVGFVAEPERRRAIISIQVPDDQPPGLYTGALLDPHDGSTVGSLSLRIQ
jgi:hypothetical protein